jgi:signal transduction histidine kinase
VDFEREHLPSVNLELFRIVQEALSNAVRLGGNLEISSAKSKGTRISVRIPDGSGAAQE